MYIYAVGFASPASKVLIKNNLIDGKYSGLWGIDLMGSNWESFGYTVTNNDISGIRYFPGTGISAAIESSYCSKITIKNNYIHDTANNWGILCANPSDVVITNNIISGNIGGGIYAGAYIPGASKITLTNNTILNGNVTQPRDYPYTTRTIKWNIKNCILWDGSSIDPGIAGNITAIYSDIYDYAEDPAKGIISRDPVFDNNYRPQNQDCLNGGQGGTEMGAYGGSGAGDGIGRQS